MTPRTLGMTPRSVEVPSSSSSGSKAVNTHVEMSGSTKPPLELQVLPRVPPQPHLIPPLSADAASCAASSATFGTTPGDSGSWGSVGDAIGATFANGHGQGETNVEVQSTGNTPGGSSSSGRIPSPALMGRSSSKPTSAALMGQRMGCQLLSELPGLDEEIDYWKH